MPLPGAEDARILRAPSRHTISRRHLLPSVLLNSFPGATAIEPQKPVKVDIHAHRIARVQELDKI